VVIENLEGIDHRGGPETPRIFPHSFRGWLGVTTVLLIVLAATGAASAAPQISKEAPEFVLSELSGEIFDLSKLRGKVVLVNYWATWCAPCRKEMPILDSFYRRYHERGLEIIGISADRPEDFARMQRVSKMLAYPTSTLDRVLRNGFGTPDGFPLTYVIDRDGIVRDKFIDVREQLLREVVVPLLKH
jgi:cytochrome c biogenesis protein CcmG, thiol:disulfide interchange protein DsbE